MTRNLPSRTSRIASAAAAAAPSPERDQTVAEHDQPASLPPVPERNPEQPAAVAELSAREREVLCWAQQGKTYWEIGCILGITQRTVKFHIQRIKSKLDVVSIAHAIAQAMRRGIIS
jgi:DNA-binding CsgD family transcriptional regulator